MPRNMIHDPLCRNAKRIDPHYDTQGRCDCDLIARVRADERLHVAQIIGLNDDELEALEILRTVWRDR